MNQTSQKYVILFFSALISFAVYSQSADVVYLNGQIYQVNDSRDWAEALAIKDGKFIQVGTKEQVSAFVSPTTQVIDLEGRMVMPGIHDLHAHPVDAGLKELYQCGFPFTLTIDEIVARLKTCAKETPEGQWIRGGQWATELMESETVPHKSILDAVTTEHPVYLGDAAVHGAWLNSKALEVLGIDKNTQAPIGGVIVKDAAGEPTGVLQDNAAYDVLKRIPAYEDEEYKAAIRWATGEMSKVGVTSVKDALVDGYTLKAYKALDQSGQLPLRIATSLAWKASWTESSAKEKENIRQRASYEGERVSVDFIKIFLDGIPPTRTAAMLSPYVANETHGDNFRGKLIHTPEQLNKDVTWLDAQGLTVKIHATGDRSARIALDAFQAARRANGNARQVHEVSHAEFIHPDDIPRFQKLNVAAEMCPILWYPSPLVLAMNKVVGEKYAGQFWPTKSLLQSGALLIYGSDWPSVVPDPSPWPGIEAMVTRRNPYTNGGEQLWAGQAIELPQVIEIFTQNGAVGMKNSARTGSIEAGKYADFIVLDRNIFAIPITDVSDTKVLKTVVGGSVVYSQ